MKDIKVEVIDKRTGEVIGDFYEMFVDALKNDKEFKLKDCIVEEMLIFWIFMKELRIMRT